MCRFTHSGAEKLAVLDQQGRPRDASEICSAAGREWLEPETLRELELLDVESLPTIPQESRIAACIATPSKFIGIGLNYRDHVAEVGLATPTEPAVFLKAPSSICGPHDDVCLASDSVALDWEVELGVVIGQRAVSVNTSDAMNHVAGYCAVIDFSDRIFQLERGGQWTKGKSADTYGPVGPWFVTTSEVEDPSELTLWLSVDGELRQSGSTRDMIWDVKSLVSYVSKFMTLEVGDLIATGTPAGVALGKKPPPYLSEGAVVRCGISQMGEQCHRVIRRA
jgi:2-keto-4-pentenoate hydratase/2-oxohepta-3-ene-1,7-dioic acid hydratase in catechol pathway